MSNTTDSTLAPGTRLAHYEVKAELGAGAMGTVYAAHDTALDRIVAVKVLRSQIAGMPGVSERFLREARAAARASHPNLTHVYFVGREGDLHFFAMENVPGTTLERRVLEQGPLPLAAAIDCLVQAARGLEAAHAVGVVHRDVKPSNLMLLPDGSLKVTDFGLAKSVDGDVDLTGAGNLMGTPTFMSPEQCRGRQVDVRTDVYSLGLTAWFTLVGRPPYATKQLGELLDHQMNRPLESAVKERPDLPPAVDEVLGRMCAKDPQARPGSMAEVVALLEGMRPREVRLAPLSARWAATAIDVVIGSIVVSALMFLVLLAFGATESELPVGLEVATDVLAFGAFALPLLGLELWIRTTAGKYLFHLRVSRADGTEPSRAALAVRFLVRFPLAYSAFVPESALPIPVMVLAGLQFLVIAADATFFLAKGHTLVDRLTGTRVVYR